MTAVRPIALHARRRLGFTVVEALAGLVFVGVVLPVALQGIRQAARAGRMAQMRMQAVQLAEAKLGELLATGDWLYGNPSEPFEDWPEFRWEATVESWSEAGDLDTIDAVTVRVAFTVQGREYDVAVTTLADETAATETGTSPGLSSGTTTTGAAR